MTTNMTTLIIPKIECSDQVNFEKINTLIEDNGVLQSIENVNWLKYPYKPDVKFRIAHISNEIWLKFYVSEKNIMAMETCTNGDVYKDSTVEFFISLDGKNYYNFEFNCIGTIHLGYGSQRDGRLHIEPEIAEKIRIWSSLGNKPFEEKQGGFIWEMTICIPSECFVYDNPETFNGVKATANFYKCGDETSDPHYISWKPVSTENPDYHRPEFFDTIEFEK